MGATFSLAFGMAGFVAQSMYLVARSRPTFHRC